MFYMYIPDIYFVVFIADTAMLSPALLMAVTDTLYPEYGYRLSKTTVRLSVLLSIGSPTSSIHWPRLMRLYRRMYLSARQRFDVDSDHDTRSSFGEEVADTVNSFTGPGTNNKENTVKHCSIQIQVVLSLH